MMEAVHLDYSGKFTSRGEWIHPQITIATTEIIIVTDGHFSMYEGEEQYELAPGSVLFLEPGIEHGGIGATNERVSFYWLHMTGFSRDEWEHPKSFTLREPLHATLLCQQILHYSSRQSGADVTDRLLYVLLRELANQCRDDDSEGALSHRIREWVRINSDRAVTAADVSAKFGYNEDYISRLMRRHYGCGLKALISEMKVNYIRYLLRETDETLTEIADRAGFSDYKLFLKFFKGTSKYSQIKYPP
ncbi:MAG: AraC family transcriptional regulator [Ruminococcaceae bacterium]|nr:AraC family transcriptional regulator [Oscillospiraceae bacterium]